MNTASGNESVLLTTYVSLSSLLWCRIKNPRLLWIQQQWMREMTWNIMLMIQWNQTFIVLLLIAHQWLSLTMLALQSFCRYQPSLLATEIIMSIFLIVTSLAGAVAKYCNEHVCVCLCLYVCVGLCVCVCLSTSISRKPHAQSSPNFLKMKPVAVARSSSGRWWNPKGKGQFRGFSSPLTMHWVPNAML